MIRVLNPLWPDIGLPKSIRIMIALATIAGLLCVQASFSIRKCTQSAVEITMSLPWRSLAVVAVPFLLAYIVALAPIGLMDATLDRYLLPLVAVGMILLVRHYQETVRRDCRLQPSYLCFSLRCNRASTT